MVFSSLFFLYIFLPLNIICYFLAKKQMTRNTILVLFSLFFYAWGEPKWLFMLLFSSGLNFAFGLLIDRWQGTRMAKLLMVLDSVWNIGLLAVFKYTDFFVGNLNGLFGLDMTLPGIALPIGISFYTFQIMSYVIDVYRGTVPVQRNLIKFLTFVTMYHQLVAGPIVRYSVVADEIDNRRVDPADIWSGFCRFFVGLSKKVIIANSAGALATQYLGGELSSLSSGGAIFGVLMFTLQIYYDFSGYSDMAIGMGRIFGFHYDENFIYPYIATSITDFWRRWHISLSSFFRDYVYIPLGGKYHHQIRNLCIVWLLTGLWHGASWNFVLWGAYYGALLILEKLVLGKKLAKLPKLVGWLYSAVAVTLGWAIFYYTDISRLGGFFRALFTGGFRDPTLSSLLANNVFWLIAAALFCVPVLPAFKKWVLLRTPDSRMKYVYIGQAIFCAAALFVCTSLLVGSSYNPFLYWNF